MKKTIIVLGCYRGGTSMVAGVLKKLGVFIGERLGTENGGSNFEDLDFQLTKDVSVMKELIANRNENYELWGYKDPKNIYYTEQLLEDLINPHFIAIFRDPFAIAMSEYRIQNRPLDTGLTIAIGHTYKIAEFITKNKQYPILPYSYEKAILDKEGFVKRVAQFIGVKINQESVDLIQPGRYVSV